MQYAGDPLLVSCRGLLPACPITVIAGLDPTIASRTVPRETVGPGSAGHAETRWDEPGRIENRAIPGTGHGGTWGAKQADAIMVLTRYLAVAIAALTTDLAAVPADGQPRPNPPVITCTNPYSGTTWQISIDYAHGTVDANPAKVSEATISWHDSKDGGNYTLDRRSGELTVVVPSSTGGYFVHHRCRLLP